MEELNIWENAEWTVQARNIIKALKQFPESSKIIMVLRHSHRNDPTELEELHDVRLTPQGHHVAKIFGKKLPSERVIRLYHSPVGRCKETAEDILIGFEEVGGKGVLKGVLTPLFFAGTAPKFFEDIVKEESHLPFLYRWAVGFYSPDRINPLQTYCRNAADVIWRGNKDAPERGIDIHITHDIFLMALRFGWFGIPPDAEWVPFLGGIAFTLTQNKIKLFDKDRFISMNVPYWWKNRI